MHRLTRFLTIGFSLILLFSASAFAQGAKQASDASYEVVLQVVIGGDAKTAGGALPQNLAAVAKQLRANYGLADFKVANTYVGRITNGGNFEFKSVSSLFGKDASTERPTFLDWSLAGFRSDAKESGKNELSLQSFRFGARIPINIGPKDVAGRDLPMYNYENIGLTSTRIALAENTPTLLGSLSLPTSDSSMFLVLTLRPV